MINMIIIIAKVGKHNLSISMNLGWNKKDAKSEKFKSKHEVLADLFFCVYSFGG